MTKRVYACILALACMITGAAKADDYANIHSIAIISAIGDCVQLRDADQSGVLFNVLRGECIAISDWKLDDAITAQISDAVKSRFTVKPVSYDRGAFAGLPWSPIPNQQTPVEKQLRALSNPGVDAYFVVAKMQISDAVGQSGTQQGGLGLANESGGLLSSDTTTMYAIYTIRVIDAKSFEVIHTEGAHLPKTGWLPRVPIVEVSNDLWSRRAANYTPQQHAMLKEQMTALVRESIGSTLDYMELGK